MEFKKKIVLSVALIGLGVLSTQAQTGIGTVNPDNSAQLEVKSTNRGLLMPRIALVKTTEQTPVVGVAAKSLMVYNTATINDVTPGFYHWDGTKWVRAASAGDIPPAGAGNITGTNLINVTNGKNNAFKDTEISLTGGNYLDLLQMVGDSINPVVPTWVSARSIVSEPWYNSASYDPATDNKQSMYTQGSSITIGKYPVRYANYISPGLDVEGAIKFGTSNTYPMQMNTLAGGADVAVTGGGSIAVGVSIISTGVQSATFGGNNTNKSNYSLVAGWNNVAGYAGSDDWNSVSLLTTTIFGQGNSVLLSAKGLGPVMNNNTIFGNNNKIDSQGLIPINFDNNTIFGDTNVILGGQSLSSKNNTIFGSHNSIPVYRGANAAIFGQDNIANKSNQFVLGSANENVDNALFEIGIGTTATRANALTVLNDGKTGIGTAAPTNTLHVNGTNPLRLEGLQTGVVSDKILTTDANGVVRATDAATLIPAAAGDNLGNHIATMNLDMSKKNIKNITDATIFGNLMFYDRNTAYPQVYAIFKESGNLAIKSSNSNRIGGAASDLTINETTGVTTLYSAAISYGSDNVAPVAGYVAAAADTKGSIIWKSPGTTWLDSATNLKASKNTQNIYQMGNVGIGRTPLAGLALDVSGSIRGGTNTAPLLYGGFIGTNSIAVGDTVDIYGDGCAAFGKNFAIRGMYSIAAGVNLDIASSNTAVFGSGNIGNINNSFVAGFNNKILSGLGGGPDGGTGNAIIGSNNLIGNFTRTSLVDANTVFGANNKIDGSGGGNAASNVVFGSENTIFTRTDTSSNLAIFGKNNTIVNPVAGGVYGATLFGEGNKANKNNQFVIGSYNKNADNALFEIGLGTGDGARINAMTVLNNGNIGIGTENPLFKLVVVGNVNVSANLTAANFNGQLSNPSDRRYKKDIVSITGALDKIEKIQGVEYNWKTEEFKDKNFDNKHQYGVIAQDIEKILPDVVSKDDKGYYSVNYIALVPVLVEAVKEQQKQIDELKELVKQLAAKK